jgi:hypothetical protein
MLTGKFRSVLPCIVIRAKSIETWLGVLPRLDREDAQSLAYDVFDKMILDLPNTTGHAGYATAQNLSLSHHIQIHGALVDYVPGISADYMHVRAFQALFYGVVLCAFTKRSS